ncbi:MAG TPA: alpha/beta hydrolase [Polyangia bacterium]|nr:alpha/beta hydrolase [Polyangia bacterium]
MSFFQSHDGTQLHERAWPTSGEPRAVVVIVHGYGEHIGRYDATARALADAGFTVRGFDLRGHGQSGGVRGHCSKFSEYLEDVDAEVVRARGENLPLFLLGHSFGGLIASQWALAHPEELAGLTLTSPFYGLALAVPAAKVLAGKIASRIYPSLALPSGLKGVDVSRDPEIQKAYDADPLNNKNATARWFTETSAAQVDLEARAPQLTLPVLMIAGGADGIASSKQAKVVFDRFGSRDKTFRLLDGQRHEVLNELPADRAKTLQEIAEWLRAHAGADDGKLRVG